MKALGINVDLVNSCVEDSFEKRGHRTSDNKLLREDKKWAQMLGIVIHPTITINNMTYRGEINGFNVFKAVCAGFKDMPQECKGDNINKILDNVDPFVTASLHRSHQH